MSSTEFPPPLAELEDLRQQLERSPDPAHQGPQIAELERRVAELRQRQPNLVRRWAGHHIDSLRRQRSWTRAELDQLRAASASWTAEQREQIAEKLGFLTAELRAGEDYIEQWQAVRAGPRDYVLHRYSRCTARVARIRPPSGGSWTTAGTQAGRASVAFEAARSCSITASSSY